MAFRLPTLNSACGKERILTQKGNGQSPIDSVKKSEIHFPHIDSVELQS